MHNLFDNLDYVGETIERYLTSGRTLEVVQGYGVAYTVPLRLLAYVVPVLHLVRQLPPTVVHLYTATGGVLRANPHYDAVKIVHASALIRLLLKEYIAAFHPDVLTWVKVSDEGEVNLTQEIIAAVDYLLPYAREILAHDPASQRYHRSSLVVSSHQIAFLVSGVCLTR